MPQKYDIFFIQQKKLVTTNTSCMEKVHLNDIFFVLNSFYPLI